MAERSLLLVHAHPDDETIFTGATAAHYAAQGARVTLVCCTLGEQGEIYVDELTQLAADEADQLGGYRLSELHAACQELGLDDVRLLGGAGRYRDSGMPGAPSNAHPRAFGYGDSAAAVGELAAVIRQVRPGVVLTYAENGTTAHPDHVQTHRVTMAAIDTAAGDASDPWQVGRAYAPVFPLSLVSKGAYRFFASSENPFAGLDDVSELPFVVPDKAVAVRIDASRHGERKLAALAAHATQIRTDTWLYALATNLGIEPPGVEYYRRLPVGESADPAGGPVATDLFAGL